MTKAMTPNFIPQARVTTTTGLMYSTVAAGTDVIATTHPICKKTNSGAEAGNTLANGTYAGQMLTIILVATGGASTITPVTSTGCTTIVLTAVHDQVTLMWVDSTVGWIVLGAVGAANTPTVT